MRNAITDVPGIRVGHAQRTGDGWLTGTTVVVPPAEGGVDEARVDDCEVVVRHTFHRARVATCPIETRTVRR